MNARSSGPLPAVIRQAPRRVCVVSGVNKAKGLSGALAGRLTTDLVVDLSTAEAILELADARGATGRCG